MQKTMPKNTISFSIIITITNDQFFKKIKQNDNKQQPKPTRITKPTTPPIRIRITTPRPLITNTNNKNNNNNTKNNKNNNNTNNK